MIIRPDGNLARKQIYAMSARQVTWFIDPEALLRHLGDLGSVHVAAYCQHCYERGLPEDVTATFDPEKREWTVRCACADYPPIKDNGNGPMTIRKPLSDGTTELIKVHSVDELLFRLGWSFKCAAKCAALGMHDGIEGNNDPQTHTLKVSCGCTERFYREPSQVH